MSPLSLCSVYLPCDWFVQRKCIFVSASHWLEHVGSMLMAGNAGCGLCEACSVRKGGKCVCTCASLSSQSLVCVSFALWCSADTMSAQNEYWVVMECGTSRSGCWRTQHGTFWGIMKGWLSQKLRSDHHLLCLTCMTFFVLWKTKQTNKHTNLKNMLVALFHLVKVKNLGCQIAVLLYKSSPYNSQSSFQVYSKSHKKAWKQTESHYSLKFLDIHSNAWIMIFQFTWLISIPLSDVDITPSIWKWQWKKCIYYAKTQACKMQIWNLLILYACNLFSTVLRLNGLKHINV